MERRHAPAEKALDQRFGLARESLFRYHEAFRSLRPRKCRSHGGLLAVTTTRGRNDDSFKAENDREELKESKLAPGLETAPQYDAKCPPPAASELQSRIESARVELAKKTKQIKTAPSATAVFVMGPLPTP